MYSGVFPPKRRFWGSGKGWLYTQGCTTFIKTKFCLWVLITLLCIGFFFAKRLKLFHLHNLGFVFSYYKFLGL